MPWEMVDDDLNPTTERLEVPGGWLYRSVWRHQHTRFDSQEGCGMAFVPKLNDGSAQMEAQIVAQEAMREQSSAPVPEAEPDPQNGSQTAEAPAKGEPQTAQPEQP